MKSTTQQKPTKVRPKTRAPITPPRERRSGAKKLRPENPRHGEDTPTQSRAPVKAASGVRVRMYRVGFGDFFLVSVPSKAGASHILIDCGVHARDPGSIRDSVTEMAQDCTNLPRLAHHDAPARRPHLRLQHLQRHLREDHRRPGLDVVVREPVGPEGGGVPDQPHRDGRSSRPAVPCAAGRTARWRHPGDAGNRREHHGGRWGRRRPGQPEGVEGAA